MKYRKIFRSITFLFAAILILMSVPSTAFAADASAVEKIQASDVYEDLRIMGFDMSKYSKDETAEHISLIDFLEFGFDYNGSTSKYGLYVYIYNPSGKSIDVYSTKNKISLQATKPDGTESGFSNYRLVYLDSNEDKSLYKFKVNVPQSFMLKLSKTQRQYEIGDIELKYEGENHKSYGAGGLWIYYGYQAYCGLDRTSSASTLKYTATELQTIELEIHPASWKTETSDKGEGYQYELSSVYFSVPNSIIRQYGDFNDATKGLRAVKGEYSQYKVNGVLTSNSSFYEDLYSSIGKAVSNKDNEINYSFLTEAYDMIGGIAWYMYKYYPASFWNIQTGGTSAYNELDSLNSAYLYGVEENFESSDWFLKAFENLQEEIGTFYGKPLNVNFSYEVTTEDENFNNAMATYINKLSSSNFFSRWFEFGYKFEDEIQDLVIPIEPLRIVATSDVSNKYNDEYNARQLFVSETDFEDLKSHVNSIDTALETTYLMRFSLTDYYCSDIFVARKGFGNDIDYGNGNYFFEKDIFLDFDILSLTWQNKHGGMKTIPVSATSIDIVGSITKPSNTNDDTDKNPLGCNIADLSVFSLLLGVLMIIVVIIGIREIWYSKLSSKAIERRSEHQLKEKYEVRKEERGNDKKGDKK